MPIEDLLSIHSFFPTYRTSFHYLSYKFLLSVGSFLMFVAICKKESDSRNVFIRYCILKALIVRMKIGNS